MKIRDRQEKVERLLTLSNRGPFREASTHVTGKVDVLGALFFMDIVDEQKHDTVLRSGIRTGIDARLAFESRVRDSDTLTAEFVASERGQGDAIGGPLSLAKVMYTAHVSDWFSALAIPMGGRCRDVDVATSSRQVTLDVLFIIIFSVWTQCRLVHSQEHFCCTVFICIILPFALSVGV